jgi:starch phosphorylase
MPAGIDRFPRDLVAQHFGGDTAVVGVPVDRVLALGVENYPGGDPNFFNMAVMGLRLGQRANGVSRLHGEVSPRMFGTLWSGFDAAEVPISSVTNGVHAPTWVAREFLELAQAESTEGFDFVDGIDSQLLWDIKRDLRRRLVEEVRRRVRDSWLQRGAALSELGWTRSIMDPDICTIGFARRVPSYKRLTLMLRDPERLRSLLLHPERPIQIVIAGKAHPADEGGKRLIQEMVRFADDPRVRHRIAFLPDYDIAMAQPLYPGCDVWLNNPLRPYEACGTSGMKAALNGGLNLSILDGWWDEWYDGDNGWAIPSADGVDDTERRDDIESEALYDLIEEQVTARFYGLDDQGLPGRWLEMVRHTLKTLGPKVLSTRMLSDYVASLYVPTARNSAVLSGDHEAAESLAAWKATVRAGWPHVHIDHVEASGSVTRWRSGRPCGCRYSSPSGTSAPRTSASRSCTAGQATTTSWTRSAPPTSAGGDVRGRQALLPGRGRPRPHRLLRLLGAGPPAPRAARGTGRARPGGLARPGAHPRLSRTVRHVVAAGGSRTRSTTTQRSAMRTGSPR